MSAKQPVYFIPHGGGPCFFMDWNPPDTWNKMATWLRDIHRQLPERPRAILVISAHWEESEFTLTAHPEPSLIYDYYGFPAHTYQLRYDAPGSVSLAREIMDLFGAAGIPIHADQERGFDHGVFIPFKLIYPEADIPIVQLSLKRNLDATTHIRAGEALQSLREKGILIVGSGMSYHNMQGFFSGNQKSISDRFDEWLTEVTELENPQKRNSALGQWDRAPMARLVHPREEHLIPHMVASGAAGDDRGKKVFSDTVMGVTISAFRFG